MRMSHRQAVALMVLVTLMWSMAGIVTRQIEVAQGLTLTFWRSAFNALALLIILCVLRTPRGVWLGLRTGGKALWASGLCWGAMFTAFMWALTLTTIANVLVTMALGPIITALLARWLLKRPLAAATVVAVVVAGLGLVIMQLPALWPQAAENVASVSALNSGLDRHAQGLLLALAVPTAGALNWVLIRGVADRRSAQVSDAVPQSSGPDFLLAVLIGASLSMLMAALGSNPAQASSTDVAWLALLGVFQLAVPCLLAVKVATVLQPSEVALLSLLEVLFGVAWAWLGTSEQPDALVLGGGALVLVTLVAHELWPNRRAVSAN